MRDIYVKRDRRHKVNKEYNDLLKDHIKDWTKARYRQMPENNKIVSLDKLIDNGYDIFDWRTVGESGDS
jgi:hypothetical protein